jgi:di/tricarboxylate transporter
MGHVDAWIMDIIAPAILLIALIWLVLRTRSNRTDNRTEAGTREVYREEETRRREGTDDL